MKPPTQRHGETVDDYLNRTGLKICISYEWQKLAENTDLGQNNPTNCYTWLGEKTADGYPIIDVNGYIINAHRRSYKYYWEDDTIMPPGHELDHVCRNRACINPWHLQPVTPQENKRRAREPREKSQQRLAIMDLRAKAHFGTLHECSYTRLWAGTPDWPEQITHQLQLELDNQA
jgi:hypothetical protein